MENFFSAELVYFGTITASVAFNAIGVGIGQGLISQAALNAINQQPSARSDIARAAFLGIALIETTAVLGTLIAVALLTNAAHDAQTLYARFAALGIAFAICISGFVLGIASSFPAQAACISIARQPFLSQNIIRFMLITLSLLQTPIIFGFIVAFLIYSQAATIDSLRDCLRLIASGISIGIGSIGPSLGLALFAYTACSSLGIHKKAYNALLSFTFVSQAIIETPIIFSLIIAILLLFGVPQLNSENILDGIIFICAGLTIGLGTFGPGISSGNTASAAARNIVLYPHAASTLARTSMFTQGIIETGAIYCFLIALILLLLR